MVDDTKRKINSAVVRLIQSDPDFANNISKLADSTSVRKTLKLHNGQEKPSQLLFFVTTPWYFEFANQ